MDTILPDFGEKPQRTSETWQSFFGRKTSAYGAVKVSPPRRLPFSSTTLYGQVTVECDKLAAIQCTENRRFVQLLALLYEGKKVDEFSAKYETISDWKMSVLYQSEFMGDSTGIVTSQRKKP